MKPRTEVRVSELKNEHNGRNRTYDMRSEDRSATCCHHRYYHLCCKGKHYISKSIIMDEKKFIRQLEAHQKELNRLIHRRLPVLIGRMAKDHFQNNFRLQGFLNNGLTRWPETRRQQSGGKSAASQYGPLLSGRNHLFASIKYSPADASVIIANDLLYAPLHNWGGSTHPAVTDKMRRFAWAMFYKEAGIKRAKSGKTKKKKMAAAAENPRASRWKALALTKKTKLNIRIPQRQFIGDSRELSDKVQQKITTEIHNILNA